MGKGFERAKDATSVRVKKSKKTRGNGQPSALITQIVKGSDAWEKRLAAKKPGTV